MFRLFKKTKWNTVNVISDSGLTAKISQFGRISNVDVVIKVQEKEGDTNTIRCICDTGFASEQVSAEYVMGLFGIKNINDLTTFRVK